MIRSVSAVIAGFMAYGLLTMPLSNLVASIFPGNFIVDGTRGEIGINLALLVQHVLISLICGFITALIAKKNPMGHVLVLGFVNLAMGIFVQIGAWDLMPPWYHISFLILVIPGVLLGGWMKTRHGFDTASPL